MVESIYFTDNNWVAGDYTVSNANLVLESSEIFVGPKLLAWCTKLRYLILQREGSFLICILGIKAFLTVFTKLASEIYASLSTVTSNTKFNCGTEASPQVK